MPGCNPQQRQPSIRRIRGDSLTCLPGKGVVVGIRDETRGTIDGTDFARALLGIWLGAGLPNHTLKTGPLGRQ